MSEKYNGNLKSELMNTFLNYYIVLQGQQFYHIRVKSLV